MLFTKYINLLINKDNISVDQRTSWMLQREVIFLKKKSTDILNVSNYRPISLLESTYILICQNFLFQALKIKLCANLSVSQFGFVRGKQMASNLMIQIILALKNKQQSAALISIDIKAAFDTRLAHLFPDNPLIATLFRFSHKPIAKVNIDGILGQEI